MHHTRQRPPNRRAGGKLCKPWKLSGYATARSGGESFGNHRRRAAAADDLRPKLMSAR
jgi:hypothetical protein